METHNPCMTSDELKVRIASGEQILLIDVRNAEEYAQRHIPGAIHIGLNQLESGIEALGQKTKYITLCGKGGGRSAEAADILNRAGYKAWWLCGGTFGWQEQS